MGGRLDGAAEVLDCHCASGALAWKRWPLACWGQHVPGARSVTPPVYTPTSSSPIMDLKPSQSAKDASRKRRRLSGAASAITPAKGGAPSGTLNTTNELRATPSRKSLDVYQKIPPSISKDLPVAPGATDRTTVNEFALNLLDMRTSAAQDTIDQKLKHKAVILDNPGVKLKPKKHSRGPSLSVKQRKLLALPLIEPENCKYGLYLPLNQLWTKYISHVLDGHVGQNIADRLLKADYHGAIFTVVRAKCPSFVGARGIVLQETENIFRVITKQNTLKAIPKANTVFAFEHGPHLAHVYGNHIRFKASERAARKFKPQSTIDL